ncbi:MAG: biotin--[Clostridia bacterium]|nr:biotin--[acetyl-CoA-carboxylase] ligase [Clostridia bacterium]
MTENSSNFDILTKEGILSHIKPEFSLPQIQVFDTVTSTNLLAKEAGVSGLPHGSIIVASHQTAGRGRLGRTFYSPSASGIYMSTLLRPTLSLEETTLITTCAAVSVCEAIEALTDLSPKIKWVNDIFINGKKVCGILTESVLSTSGSIDFSVLGIGINVYPPENGFPDDISNIATALFTEPVYGFRNRLVAEIYNSFMSHYDSLSTRAHIPLYKSRCFVLNKPISVISNGTSTPATALDIDNDCRLLVKYENGSQEYLSSGEISIRV